MAQESRSTGWRRDQKNFLVQQFRKVALLPIGRARGTMTDPVMMVMKSLLSYALIVLTTILVFDVSLYFILPTEYVLDFDRYQELHHKTGLPNNIGSANTPKDYYVKDDKRGFDIGPRKNGYHRVPEVIYPIWSNSLGCFDTEHASAQQYVYLTGDSYTWGYAPFEHKFGTIVEKLTGTPIFKCGVNHTGQQHQYDKFVEIVDRIGILPKAIIIEHCANDIANDHAYPHSTVMDGWLIDNVELTRADNVVKVSDEELRKRLENSLLKVRLDEVARSLEVQSWWQTTKLFLKEYSLSTHLVKSLIYKMSGASAVADVKIPGSDPVTGLRSFYYLDKDSTGHWIDRMERHGQYWYVDNPKAVKNQQAILAFQAFAVENHIPLILVLMPYKAVYANTHYYASLRSFLTANEIRFLDLTSSFAQGQWSPEALYWRHDGHLSPKGNKIVADILIKELPDVFLRKEGTHS